jgi:hypothetical protein
VTGVSSGFPIGISEVTICMRKIGGSVAVGICAGGIGGSPFSVAVPTGTEALARGLSSTRLMEVFRGGVLFIRQSQSKCTTRPLVLTRRLQAGHAQFLRTSKR